MPWQPQPICPKANRFSQNCSFNHETGRGLFIYQEPEIRSFPNYLVCASSTSKSSWPWSAQYVIAGRCIVSSLNWASYLRLDPKVKMRSDVKGLVRWPNTEGNKKTLLMPALLAKQCASAFPGALYCSPQLIVMPTAERKKLDVCLLQTESRAFNAIFVQIESISSHWECERKDLAEPPEPDGVLSTREQECVPDFTGKISSGCDLPYIPRTQNDIREFRRY